MVLFLYHPMFCFVFVVIAEFNILYLYLCIIGTDDCNMLFCLSWMFCQPRNFVIWCSFVVYRTNVAGKLWDHPRFIWKMATGQYVHVFI